MEPLVERIAAGEFAWAQFSMRVEALCPTVDISMT